MRIVEHVVVDATQGAVWTTLLQVDGLISLFAETLTVEDAEASAPVEAGSKFRFVWHLGATAVGCTVEVIELSADELVWVGLTGTPHRCRIRATSQDDGTTRVSVQLAYEAPGPLGFVADLFAVRRIQGALRQGLKNLATNVAAS